MTPKEKAKEILKTFDNIPRYAKKAVDEMLNAIDLHQFEYPNKEINYWLDVRLEIEKLCGQ